MSESFDLEGPDHFTAGAVGPPGQRVFYLQAREAGAVVTLKCEKAHVRALGDYLAALLDRLAVPPAETEMSPDLLEPLLPAWDVGAIGVGYDETGRRIVIEAHEAPDEAPDEEASEASGEEPVEEPDAPAAPGALARLRVTHGQAAAFVARARELMRGGRPICPMCQASIDPEGHTCPRANGHVKHAE